MLGYAYFVLSFNCNFLTAFRTCMELTLSGID